MGVSGRWPGLDINLQVDGGQVTGTALLTSIETNEDVEAVMRTVPVLS